MFTNGDGLKLLVGIFALGGLVAGSEIHRFERDAAADVATKLEGPGKRVSLKTVAQGPFGLLKGDVRRGTIFASDFSAKELPLFTEPSRPQTGRLRELRLELDRFSLAGLRIDHLEAIIPDCRYDLGLAKREHKIRLSHSGEGQGLVRIKEHDLEDFVLHKYREIKSVSIHLRNGRAEVEGEGEFLLIRTRFHVVAKLSPVDLRRLSLTDATVDLNGEPAGPEASAALLKGLNPVVDLDKDLRLHGAIDVGDVALERGNLTARGATRIPSVSEAPEVK